MKKNHKSLCYTVVMTNIKKQKTTFFFSFMILKFVMDSLNSLTVICTNVIKTTME